MAAPSSYTQSWGESIENQITTFNAQLNDIDSRLRAINSCQCNEEQIRAAINVMSQKVSELSTAVQEVQANLKALEKPHQAPSCIFVQTWQTERLWHIIPTEQITFAPRSRGGLCFACFKTPVAEQNCIALVH